MAYKNKVFDTISDLKSRVGSPNVRVKVQGYYTTEDGGGGEFFWDAASTATDDGGVILSVAGVGTGRWRRIVNGSEVRLQWFGGKQNSPEEGNSFIDVNADLNKTAFDKACTAITNSGGKYNTIYIPATGSSVFSSRRMEPKGGTLKIRGDRGKTVLAFNGTAGVWVLDENISASITLEDFKVLDLVSNESWLADHGGFSQDAKGPDYSKPGIYLNAPFLMSNVDVEGFKGDGIIVYGNSGDNATHSATKPIAYWNPDRIVNNVVTPGWTNYADGNSTGRPSSNVNKWQIYGGSSSHNIGAGIATYGPDANAGLCMMTEFKGNGTWAIKEASQLGNVYIGCPVLTGQTLYVFGRMGCKLTVNSVEHWFICRQDNVATSPTVTNGVAQKTEYWEPYTFTTEQKAKLGAWTAFFHYQGTGSYNAGKNHWVAIVGKNSKPYGNKIDKNIPGTPNPTNIVANYTPLDLNCVDSLTPYADAATTPNSFHNYTQDANKSLFLGMFTDAGQLSAKLDGNIMSIGGSHSTTVEAGGNFVSSFEGSTQSNIFTALSGYLWQNGVANFVMSATDLTLSSNRKLIMKAVGGVSIGVNGFTNYHITGSVSNPNKHIWGSPSVTTQMENGEKYQMWGGNLNIVNGGLQVYNPDNQVTNKIYTRSAKPTTGAWIKGDFIFNANPGTGNLAVAWRCSASGTPGTWDDVTL